MSKQRVVVVGAGVLGMFTALELVSGGGYDVTVIDQAHPGAGSSGRSVGMVETQYFTRAHVEVRAYGREVYSRLEHDHGLGFVHGGYLRLGRTSEDLDLFAQSLGFQRDFGVNDAWVLPPSEIAARWPQIVTEDLAGGLYGSWDGYVDGYEVSQLLATLVKTAGGKVRSRVRLLSAMRHADVWRLETSNGAFEADCVVNAAGPWGGVVGELLGAPVPLIPQLHGATAVRLSSPQPLSPFVMDYMPGSGTDGVYFRSENAEQLIVGLHTDEAISAPVSPDTPLGALAPEVLERMVTLLSARLRKAEDLSLGRSWTGIYPMSPDHEPLVGCHPDAAGVVCALGAGGSGIQLSPAIGRLAADAVMGNPDSPFSGALGWSPDRFANPGHR